MRDVFERAIENYFDEHGRTRPVTGGDIESFETWLGQDPNHEDTVAVVPALLCMWLVCPLKEAQLSGRPTPGECEQWALVDERALVDVEEWR